MRPQLFVFLVLVILPLASANAQDIYDRGYIIKNNGDSLAGYLLYNGAPARYFKLQYKNRTNTAPVFIASLDIVRFKIGDDLYVKETVDMYEPLINPFEKTISTLTHQMTCFLLRKAAGPVVDLYSYNGERQRFFIRIKIHKDSMGTYPGLQELVYWEPAYYNSVGPFEKMDIRSYSHIDSQMVREKGQSLFYFGYRRQLSSLLKNPEFQIFRNLPYLEPFLVAAIDYINGGGSWNPPTIPRDVTAKVFIAAGVTAGRTKAIEATHEKATANFPWRIFPVLAAGVELQAPKDAPSFCARMQLSWTRFNTGTGRMDFFNRPTYYLAYDIQSLALTLAPTWKIANGCGPFILYMGPELTLEELFINTTRFGSEMGAPLIDWYDARFQRMMATLGIYWLLRAEKYALTIQAPVLSSKILLGNTDYMLGKTQAAIGLSYNLLGHKARKLKKIVWLSH
ncbi:hypothetical protein [Chitinophaga tropicalis]|uniref:Uncharacterized protein n=1 Tax=Chitinophaga tropicalis TaxID=2683588 RepID=A0A7K1U026_9BACT|nr:hypothetical protein [Chitinophaga tropicalis]MVT07712.1 hypothetical protein [Chitinophaga tropicalis]